MPKEYRLLLGKSIPVKAYHHVISQLCFLQARVQKNALSYNACCYTDAPLRWWIRAVESILPWLLTRYLCSAPDQLWRSLC